MLLLVLFLFARTVPRNTARHIAYVRPVYRRSDEMAAVSSDSDFPSHFNESELFRGGKQARKLKLEFRDHFRNISRIMDCVGCEKCKLWGTLQVGRPGGSFRARSTHRGCSNRSWHAE